MEGKVVMGLPVAPEVSEKVNALDGIYKIGRLLGYASVELLKPEVIRTLMGNTRPQFMSRKVIDLCVDAAKDYAAEKKKGQKILSSWKKYAIDQNGNRLKTPDDIYNITSAVVMTVACSLGIFPYTIDTTGGGGTASLRAMIRGSLESILSPPLFDVATYIDETSEEMKKFYDMKKTQTLDDLKIIDPSLPDAMCPLLPKYRLGKYLGGGTYGVVLKVTASSSSSKLGYDEYALKIQSIYDEQDSVSTAYLELRSHDLIMQGLPKVNIGARLTNVVKLYDWVKCKMDLQKKLQTLPGDYSKVFQKGSEVRDTFLGDKAFQFTISEFADRDCYKMFTEKARLCFMGDFMRGFLVQILCSLSHLQDRIRFTHYDLHLQNILEKKIPPSDTPEYLHYEVRGKHLYVSMNSTDSGIFKISDFGLTHAQYYVDDDPVPKTIAAGSWYNRPEGKGDRFNPRYDMHKLGCSIIERLFYEARMGVVDVSEVEPALVSTLLFMINSRWNDPDNKTRYKKITDAVAEIDKARLLPFPSDYTSDKPAEDILEAGEDACIDLRMELFIVDEEPSSWIMTVLGYKFFAPCYQVPDKSANLIDMDLIGRSIHEKEVRPSPDESELKRDRYGNIFAPYEPKMEGLEAPEELPSGEMPDEVMEICDWFEVVKGVWICSEDPVNEEHGNYKTCMERTSLRGYRLPKFEAILNAAIQDVKRPKSFKGEYYAIPGGMQDVPFNAKWTKGDFLEKVDAASDVIDGWVRRGITPILVHCVAGQNRSVAVMVAYLMKHRKWSFDAAFARMIYANESRFGKQALTQRPFLWALKIDYAARIR